jgi:hypothetical protein
MALFIHKLFNIEIGPARDHDFARSRPEMGSPKPKMLERDCAIYDLKP